MAERETGHRYWEALNSKPRKIPRDAPPMPTDFTLALAIAASPEKYRIPTVFFSGRVYKEMTTGPKGETIYEGRDPWREEAAKAAEAAGVIYVDGVGWNLADPVLSAGKGLGNINICPVVVVNAIGRVGPATHQEAITALGAGSNVGIMVPEDEFAQTVEFLAGTSPEYPPSLPAWWGSCDLVPGDVIKGFAGLSEWIETQMRLLTPAAFRGRSLSQSALAHIMMYGHLGLANDPGELELLDRVLSRVY